MNVPLMRHPARHISSAILAAFISASAIADEFVPMVIKVHDENEVAELRDAGAEILRRRGDMLLCFMPQNGSETPHRSARRMPKKERRLKTDPEKRYMDWGNVPTLDMAVAKKGASGILTGDGFSQAFTGKGVVVGICDIGFDPLHPTFLDNDGKSRVKRVTQYKESEGVRLVLEGIRNMRNGRPTTPMNTMPPTWPGSSGEAEPEVPMPE